MTQKRPLVRALFLGPQSPLVLQVLQRLANGLFGRSNHPKAKRAYAWSSPIEGNDKRRFFAVLQMEAIKSPRDAVRPAIVAEKRSREAENDKGN
jgi:hypothetical protein